MTTFNSLLRLHRLTTLPMGHTNAVQIYQADMAFILQDDVETRTSLCLYFTSFTFHPTALLLSIHSELPISC